MSVSVSSVGLNFLIGLTQAVSVTKRRRGMREDKKREPAGLRSLLRALPKPLAVWRLPRRGARFELYRAKGLGTGQWDNAALFGCTLLARRSYRRYGEVPVLDSYDEKSAVYLVRARYRNFFPGQQRYFALEEWLSVRFIPASGSPPGTSDFDECSYQGEGVKLQEAIKERLFRGHADFLDGVVTISKVCGIHPYYAAQQEKDHGPPLAERHKYTDVCFALINKQFLEDYAGHPFRYLTGLFRDELIGKSLAVQAPTGEQLPEFTPAYATLGCAPSDIRLNRDASTYLFPGYFLRADQMIELLAVYINTESLPLSALHEYIPVESEDELLSLARQPLRAIEGLRRLGMLLHGVPGTGGEVGQKLRGLFDRFAADGPQLKIMERRRWNESIERFFQLKESA